MVGYHLMPEGHSKPPPQFYLLSSDAILSEQDVEH